MIDDPVAARRLARAICADVELYNASKIQGLAPADAGRVLGEPLYEGRQLYVTRVTQAHAALFDEVAREMCERLGIPYHPTAPVPRPAPEPVPHEHPPVPREIRTPPASGVSPALVVLIGAACAIAGAAVFFLLTR